MAIRIRGTQARSDLYWNRLCDALLSYDQETINEQWQDRAVGATDLRAALDATECGRRQMQLTVQGAELLAFLAYYWLDYFTDAGWDGDARNRAALCQRLLNELRLQGIQYHG